MKSIKLIPENSKAIELALRVVNGRATGHAYVLAGEIFSIVDYLETKLERLGIPKRDRVGAIATSTSSPAKMPASYKYARNVTAVSLSRGSVGWYLTAVASDMLHPNQAGHTVLKLTRDQDWTAVTHLRKGYALQISASEAADPSPSP